MGVRIKDAIRQGQRVLDAGTLSGQDAIALHCLVQMAKRVHRLQQPLRQLERALCPKEELNQESLLLDEGHG